MRTRSTGWLLVVLGAWACAGDPAGGGPGAPDGGHPTDGGGAAVDAYVSIPGDPGCGLEAAAFCDTFEAASPGGRAGELDDGAWSAGRLSPAGPTNEGRAFPVGLATLRPRKDGVELPACRADVADRVLPPDDLLVCDPSADVGSKHLLVAAAAQNYGATSLRIRRPFDFAGRTGKIVLDAEGYSLGGLLGWVSLEVTEDPIPTPGFAQLQNFEGSPVPKRGFALQLFGGSDCLEVGLFSTFEDHVETWIEPDAVGPCQAIAWGKLNHLEVRVSERRIELYASPASDDGVTFAPAVLVFAADVDLPFSRGYVHLTVHNHATLKYWETYGQGFETLDAWIARFDNVGFDGPVLPMAEELDVPLPAPGASDSANQGWIARDRADGTTGTLALDGVSLAGVTRARLALTSWYCIPCGADLATFVLHYRLNGGAWHDRTLTAAEQAALHTGSGAISHMIDVPLAELREGANTLELATTNVPQGYPPGVVNVSLVLD